MFKMLEKAAQIARTTKDRNKNFFLAAIALRADGAYVNSTNSTIVHAKTPSAHAEARVLRKAGQGSILWVARISKRDGQWAIAKPCETCQALIENKGVKTVYYTIAPNEWGVWKPNQNGSNANKKRKICKCT